MKRLREILREVNCLRIYERMYTDSPEVGGAADDLGRGFSNNGLELPEEMGEG